MAVSRRVNFISQQRVDVPDMRSLESAASSDFDSLIQAFVTGGTQGYILRGFEILMSGAIGGAASGLQMLVDPGAIFHPASSQSGTTYLVPTGMMPQQLNSATNTLVQGAFSPSAINYVGLEYVRTIDPTTDAQVYIWDPTANDETTKIAPRAQILNFNLIISSTVWASNVLPIAIVTTDAGNNVISITDSRWRLTSLGRGGANPNAFYRYPWTAQSEGRTPNPSTSNSNSVNPFHGGDKMLNSLKDWMDAVMTSFLEIKGTTYWTSTSSSGSLDSLREDLGNTILTGNSNIAHGVLPNSVPVLSTTGNINSSNQLTNLASTTGIVDGMKVMGSGIPVGTTVLGISGTTVDLSQFATATATGVPVSFYAPGVVTAPGQVNWASNPVGDGQIYLKLVGSRIAYQIAENPSGTSVTLADNQVAYLSLTRGASIIPNLVFTPNSGPNTTTVSSVGAIAWTASLQAGDFIRAAADTDAFYYQIQSVDSLTQVTLAGQYTITGITASGVQGVYAFGNYTLPGSTGTARDIVIANRESVPTGQNIVWLLLRSDDGGSIPRVYVKFLGAELQQGDSKEISGPTLSNVLQYIGSPTESATSPNYSSALSRGALPNVVDITLGAASTITTSQYFYIDSSNDTRKYYFWFKKDGTGTDPAPVANRIGVKIDITTGQTAVQVAAALVNAFAGLYNYDFQAVQNASPNNNSVTVTNSSSGAAVPASNGNVNAPFSVTVVQTGTGTGNSTINDGDNLTLAIKKLDRAIGAILGNANNPNYDEVLPITMAIASGSNLTLPNNSREGNMPQMYTIGTGALQLFLNGQYLNLNEGVVATTLTSYQMNLGQAYSPEYALNSSSKGGIALAFTPPSNTSVTDVKFILSLPASPTGVVGTMFSRIHTDTGVPSTTILGTSTSKAVSTLTGATYAVVDFNFPSPVALTGGTKYWFTIETDSTYQAGVSGSNYIIVGGTNSAQPYLPASYDGTTWTVLSSNNSPAFEIDSASVSSQYDWTEVGSSGTNSTQIQINRPLVAGDFITFRISTGSGGGSGGSGGGTSGPPGPVGPQGPAGQDAAGGPISISTKASNYTILTTDCFLKASCAGGNVVFTLPPAASASGRIFYCKKIDATTNSLTIQANGSELIDGLNAQMTITQYFSFTMISDGSTWSLF